MKVYFVTKLDERAKVVDVKTYRAKNLDNLRKRLLKEVDLNKYWVKVGKQSRGTVVTIGEFYRQWGRPVWKSYLSHDKYSILDDGRISGKIE